MKKIKSFLLLTRPLNSLITIFVVFVGLRISGCYSPGNFILASLLMVLLSSFANALNDVVDFEVDKLAHPWRPLPSGAVSLKEARVFAVALFIIVFLFSFVFGGVPKLIIYIILLLVLLYNLLLKKVALVGNLVVSVILGTVFLFTGALCGNLRSEWIPFFFAVLFNLQREIIKDTEDMDKDVKFGYKTLPFVIGIEKTRVLLILLNAIFILYTVFVYLFFYQDILYLTIMFFVNILMLAGVIASRNFTFLSLLYKILMIPTLVAIYLGGGR